MIDRATHAELSSSSQIPVQGALDKLAQAGLAASGLPLPDAHKWKAAQRPDSVFLERKYKFKPSADGSTVAAYKKLEFTDRGSGLIILERADRSIKMTLDNGRIIEILIACPDSKTNEPVITKFSLDQSGRITEVSRGEWINPGYKKIALDYSDPLQLIKITGHEGIGERELQPGESYWMLPKHKFAQEAGQLLGIEVGGYNRIDTLQTAAAALTAPIHRDEPLSPSHFIKAKPFSPRTTPSLR